MFKALLLALLILQSNCLFAQDKKYSKDILVPDYGTIPAKGEVRIDPNTGTRITRITDATEFDNTDDLLIAYSRYTPENSDGDLIIAFGSNSTSSWVVDRHSGKIIQQLRHLNNKSIGEYHEVRWDTSGKHPNRVYYHHGMKFYSIDDVTTNKEPRLIKDFTDFSPDSEIIYNDAEGDSSNDSDHWVWMAAKYNGKAYEINAFIHYQISTDKVDILKPSDLRDTNLNHYSNQRIFSKPNMVEVSPLGTGIVLHYGRCWGDEEYGQRPKDKGTWFDGPHLWPIDFNTSKKEPFRISIDQTHSGWAFDNDGNEIFVSQNNRTDKIDAVNISKGINAYNTRKEIASHRDMGWSNGFHFGKMPISMLNWVFISTYSNINHKTHKEDWAADQFLLIEITSDKLAQKIVRISPNYNKYDGKYRDEAAAAINLEGNRIYSTSNWGGLLNHREIFMFEISPE